MIGRSRIVRIADDFVGAFIKLYPTRRISARKLQGLTYRSFHLGQNILKRSASFRCASPLIRDSEIPDSPNTPVGRFLIDYLPAVLPKLRRPFASQLNQPASAPANEPRGIPVGDVRIIPSDGMNSGTKPLRCGLLNPNLRICSKDLVFLPEKARLLPVEKANISAKIKCGRFRPEFRHWNSAYPRVDRENERDRLNDRPLHCQ